jgi:8-oxo-dGTP diphosphatase
MPKCARLESASAIVFNENRTCVLLVKREDFRVWVLPGGGIEPGETREQAAIRETREETGYEIAIDCLVGRYEHPQTAGGGSIRYLFVGRIVGGAPISSGPETVGVGIFPIDALPSLMLPWVRNFIADALTNSPSVIERTLKLPLWMAIAIRIGLVVRDFRNCYFRK